jgi:type IV pilus assembly protein PilV
MLKRSYQSRVTNGFTMIEVLIAIVITAIGLLGLAGLMGKMQQAETDGFDRSQAMALLWDMSDRVYAAMPTTAATAGAYTGGTTAGSTATAGTGSSGYSSPCTGTGATLDLCEWHFALLGAAETRSSTRVGAMTGARGCVQLVTVPDPSAGICTPATFRISVTWQGLLDSLDQTGNANTCGQGQYGAETRRRIVSEMITIGMPKCT